MLTTLFRLSGGRRAAAVIIVDEGVRAEEQEVKTQRKEDGHEPCARAHRQKVKWTGGGGVVPPSRRLTGGGLTT